jgi:hypothetical protein
MSGCVGSRLGQPARRRVAAAALAALAAVAAGVTACGAAPAPAPALSPAPHASGARDGPAPRAATAGRADGPVALPRGALNAALARGPGWLLQRLPLDPVLASGRRFLGFRVVQVFDNSPAALRYGLRPGDVVRSVNGQRLARPEDMMRIIALLRTAPAVEVRGLRDGEPLELRVPIDDAKPDELPAGGRPGGGDASVR